MAARADLERRIGALSSTERQAVADRVARLCGTVEAGGAASIVAYYVGSAEAPGSAMALRSQLSEHLPQHMIPQRFTRLAELPLTPNGKLDRNALQTMEADPAPVDAGQVAAQPATGTEGYIAGVWQDLLGVASIAGRDSFFDLGGDSLTAMRFVTRVRRERGVEIPLRSVLTGSLAQLALQYPVDGTPAAEVAAPKPRSGFWHTLLSFWRQN